MMQLKKALRKLSVDAFHATIDEVFPAWVEEQHAKMMEAAAEGKMVVALDPMPKAVQELDNIMHKAWFNRVKKHFESEGLTANIKGGHATGAAVVLSWAEKKDEEL